MFWLRNEKNNFQLSTLIWGPVSAIFCFSDSAIKKRRQNKIGIHLIQIWIYFIILISEMGFGKARVFLLVDLRNFFFRSRVGGGGEKNK